MATGFGLRFSHTLHGNGPVMKRFYVPATDATALFKGDVVTLVTTTGTMDSRNEIATVTRAATGNILLGVIDGFQPSGAAITTGNYRAASTERYVNVIIDPDAVYHCQEDALGTPITAAMVGSMFNFNLIVATGDTATGLSGTMINSDSGASASAADVKVIGIPVNGGDNYVTKSGGAVYECMILAPAIKATDSQS